VARVATGDWDAIVMTHSTFELLPMSAGFTGDFIKDTIREIEMAVRMCSADSRSNRIVKQLERMKKTWKIRLERLENQDRKDDFLCWEALGVDWLAYDEAHSAKNLFRHTKMARIAGLPLSNSQRAFDLYLKTRHTMSLYRGEHRGVVWPRQPRWPTAWPRFTRSSASCSPTRCARWGSSNSTPGPPPSGRRSRRWRLRLTAAAIASTPGSRASSTCPT
jgi:hypothetical protein